VIVLFLHGWAFDRTVWGDVIGFLPGVECRVADRGYFGNPCALDAPGDTLVVAHSLGAMQALANLPAHCRGMVAINGFERFSAATDWPGIAPRVLQRMLARLDEDPASVVNEFRMRCGTVAQDGPADLAALRADLTMLRDGDTRAAAAAWRLPLITLEADDDPIVPQSLRDAAFAAVPGRVRLRRATGGHLLPLADPATCAATIRDALDALR